MRTWPADDLALLMAMKTRTTNPPASRRLPATDAAHAPTEVRVKAADLTQRRAELESRWQRKLDEAVVLSQACAEIADGGDEFADLTSHPYARLQSRTQRAYDDLADIDDAIARIDSGTFGICSDCERPMPEDWLAEEPTAQQCPGCASRRRHQRATNFRRSRSAPPGSLTRRVPAPRLRTPRQGRIETSKIMLAGHCA
jgi:RNA polymerase-binding transcription factor DksA